ncbi:MAG: sensor histidine kinase [Deltaproteobacteria bacterium]|nr:sensor histidine kinase [Deltaproteobacteria bacterium]NNG47510.1 sensor histidine kinase [Deltaproteobacteria bacterium]
MHEKRFINGLMDDLRPVFSKRMILVAWVPFLLITVLHYRTVAEYIWAHDLLRRLYYLPILFAAFSGGVRGGISVSVFASLIYFPHAFLSLVARDPGDALEKGLEILLYNIVAVVAGLLVDRERREREKQVRLAGRLTEALGEQRRIESQLIRAGRLGALGELTAGIAHEIKNPLHTMKGTAEILRDAIPPEAPERRMLEIHMEEIDRLAQNAERFLTFARPAPSDRRPLDLREVVQRVALLVETQARQEGVTTAVSRYDGGEAPLVMGDADQLTQVLLNLAINGVQAMASRGSGMLSFSVIPERQGGKDYFRVNLRNDGPPIPQDQLERIFDPFYTTKDGGTGLGLSICSRIADQHDGLLSVRNLPEGRGVEFTLALPAREGKDA